MILYGGGGVAKNSNAVIEARRKHILYIILQNGETEITDLAKKLNVFTMTIRRDVDELIERRMLQKASVGTVKAVESFEVDPGYSKRHILNQSEKTLIGMEAAKLIKNNYVIGFDASTTTMEVSKHLSSVENITVVTNGLLIPQYLATHPSVNLEMAGGKLRGAALSTVGARTCRALSRYNYDIVFISVNAVDTQYGLSDTSEEEVETKLALLRNARTKVLLVDSDKIAKRAYCKCCDISDVDIIITDQGVSQKDIDSFISQNVKVIIASI